MFRKDFPKSDELRAGIPEVITDEIIRKAAESFAVNPKDVGKDGSMRLRTWESDDVVLNDKTDPDRNFRNAIGSMALSYLGDCTEVDAYCKKKDEPQFQAMIDALPEKWDSHAMIDLHWVFLNKGKAVDEDLFEAVDKWLAKETYCSND